MHDRLRRRASEAHCIDMCVHELFAGHALATPERIAVTCAGVDVSYGDLDARADRLAERLMAAGVGRNDAVGVLLQRSVDFVVAILAVLKAGGCYVPLDPDYPAPRLAAMVAAVDARILVSRGSLPDRLTGYDGAVVDIEVSADRSPGSGRDVPPASAVSVHPADLAYIMFTSGSTGTPKGVAVRHAGIVRLVDEPDYVRLDADEVIVHLSSVAFDASTFEIWGALANGARLVVAPPGPLSPPELAGLLRDEGVTTAWLTAGLFNVMVDEYVTGLTGLRQLLTGGDVMSPHRARRFLQQVPHCRLINGYGPTEVTTFTACHTVALDDTEGPRIPVGRPITGTYVEILDDSFQPVPVGVPGLLYAGGLGVARGYVADPELTARRFVPDPWGCGQRLYATGDLATYRPDGTIDFLGRADHQFKKRGFRVEPAEVEEALRRDVLVRDAAVTLQGSSSDDATLVAYVVVDTGAKTESAIDADAPAESAELFADLRHRLNDHLPDYLLPDRFVTVDALPLNSSGKVDRRALATLGGPDAAGTGHPDHARAPSTATERALAEIWSELLGRTAVARDDDFFALGGQSLQASRMVSRIRGRLGAEITLRVVFDHPTIAELAQQVDERLR